MMDLLLDISFPEYFERAPAIYLPLARRRSLDGARPMVSRYLATVRRATRMPSPERISAMRLSDSGALGFSSRMSLRILARIAVEEVPEPSLPSTCEEKK